MQCFLARRDGQVCGRVAAIVDRNYNEFHKEDAGFFGFFESTDDVEVARAVMRSRAQMAARARREGHPRPRESLHQL